MPTMQFVLLNAQKKNNCQNKNKCKKHLSRLHLCLPVLLSSVPCYIPFLGLCCYDKSFFGQIFLCLYGSSLWHHLCSSHSLPSTIVNITKSPGVTGSARFIITKTEELLNTISSRSQALKARFFPCNSPKTQSMKMEAIHLYTTTDVTISKCTSDQCKNDYFLLTGHNSVRWRCIHAIVWLRKVPSAVSVTLHARR